MTYKGTIYNLTDSQILKIARLCTQEQGSAGAPFEASLMCNLYELHANKTKYKTLYDYVRTGGWFYKAAYYMDNGSARESVVNAVSKVIREGARVLPLYIDEHDQFSDISSATNNGKAINKTDRSAYVSNVTIIKNKMGSTYTFYSFPTTSSDPFGYTNNKRVPKSGEPFKAMCAGDGVNFRKSPNGEVIKQLNAGEVFTAYESVDKWTRIVHNGTQGYLYTQYVEGVEATAAKAKADLKKLGYRNGEILTIAKYLSGGEV